MLAEYRNQSEPSSRIAASQNRTPKTEGRKYLHWIRLSGWVRSSASTPFPLRAASAHLSSYTPHSHQLRRNLFHAPLFQAQNPATSACQRHIVRHDDGGQSMRLVKPVN